MCETKAILVLLSLFLQVASSLCKNEALTENKKWYAGAKSKNKVLANWAQEVLFERLRMLLSSWRRYCRLYFFRDCMEKNVAESKSGGTKLEIKNWKDWFQIWRGQKEIQNLTYW